MDFWILLFFKRLRTVATKREFTCENADEIYDGEETLDMENEEQEEEESDDSISSDMYESANKKISPFSL